jgi:hypothetical protein
MTIPGVDDIGQGGSPLSMGDHIIIAYGSQAQRWGVLTPFLGAGLLLRQQVLVICPDSSISEIRDKLAAAGFDTSRALEERQLIFVGPAELPIRQLEFDDVAMIDYLHSRVEQARAQGWSALRVAGEWPWFVNEADMPSVLRYEANVNREFRQWPAVLMCLYDVTGLQPGVITDLVSTHPLIVLGDRVVENDLYAGETGELGDHAERLH